MLVAETRDALHKGTDRLARAEIPDTVAKILVINLGDGLASVKERTSVQTNAHDAQLPREFAVHLFVPDLHVTKVA